MDVVVVHAIMRWYYRLDSKSISEIKMTCKKDSSMDMIAIRKTTNRIQFDFYYNCPETGQRKRNRKSTGLIDSPENRMVAQQMAKKFLNSLKTRTTDLNIELKYAISSCDAYGRTYTIESQIMLQGLAKEIGCVYALYVPQARHRDGLVDICDSIDQDAFDASLFADHYFNSGDFLSTTPDWLHISFVNIKEDFRGQKHGWFAVKEIVKIFGSNALISAVPREVGLSDYLHDFGLTKWLYQPEGAAAFAFHDTQSMAQNYLKEDEDTLESFRWKSFYEGKG